MKNIEYIKKILTYLKPYWKEEILLLLLLFIGTGFSVATPLLIGVVFDKGILNKNLNLVLTLSLVILSIYIAKKIFEYFQNLLFGHVEQSIAKDIRGQLFSKKLNLPLSYFSQNKPGEIMTILVDDVNTLSGFLSTLFVNGFSNIIIVMAISATLLIKDYRLGIISLAILSLFVVAFRCFNESFEKWGNIRRQNGAELKNKVEKSIFSVRSIKSFSNEEAEIEKFKKFNSKFFKDNMGVINLSGLSSAIIGLISMLGPLFVLFFGATEVINGVLTIGGLVAFNTLLVQLYSPAMGLAQINFNFHQTIISIKRILSFLGEKEEFDGKEFIAPEFKKNIVFKNVSFHYEQGKEVLRDINFNIPKGCFVVLYGESGQGKSTIIDLLCRFIQPIQGEILIDGIDIQKFDLKLYRKKLAVVNQDDFIDHSTLKENICYGNEKNAQSDISKIVEMVKLDSFISFQGNYDMAIGEKGSTISGGQKRKISLARVFLKNDAGIMLLDEPSSGLDPDSIKRIISAIKSFKNKKTIIIASHEKEFLREADKVFILKDGKLTQNNILENCAIN